MVRTAILAWHPWESAFNPIENVSGSWNSEGPELPLEFSRVSHSQLLHRALTLVIDPENGEPVPTLFIESSRLNPEDAAEDLRKSKETGKNQETAIVDIGLMVRSNPDVVRSRLPQGVTDRIKAWAEQNGFDVVVWSELPSNFQEETRTPFSVEHAIEYLQSLERSRLPGDDVRFVLARKYISGAPPEVNTPLRRALDTHPWWQSLGLGQSNSVEPISDGSERLAEARNQGSVASSPTETTATTRPSSPPLRGHLENFLVGMIATAVTAPGIAIAVTVVVYIGRGPDSRALALLCGILGGILGWGMLAVVVQRFVTIDRANPGVYRELHSRLAVLQAQVRELQAYDALSSEVESSQVRQSALSEVTMHLARLHAELEMES